MNYAIFHSISWLLLIYYNKLMTHSVIKRPESFMPTQSRPSVQCTLVSSSINNPSNYSKTK